MNKKLIYIYIFSLFTTLSLGQEKEQSGNLAIGVDVLNLGVSFFEDRDLYQGYMTYDYKNNWYARLGVGYEKNIYDKGGYDAIAKGFFLDLSAYKMILKDHENRWKGFYVGGGLAGSVYDQTYHKVPVKGYAGYNSFVQYPSSTQSSFWFKAMLGGRISLFKSKFYVDANLQPNYMIYSSKQDELKPLVIPGFGTGSNPFSLGFAWYLTYRF